MSSDFEIKWRKWRIENLEEMERGEYTYSFKKGKKNIFKKVKWRVPKWIWKLDGYTITDFIKFRGKYGRWPNNEERILYLFTYHSIPIRISRIVNETKIDLKNISRYIKNLETSGLIEKTKDYTYKKTTTGRSKKYHYNIVKITEKGIKVKNKLFDKK